jgi:hypothetical protein
VISYYSEGFTLTLHQDHCTSLRVSNVNLCCNLSCSDKLISLYQYYIGPADNSPLYSAEVKDALSYTSISHTPSWRGAWIRGEYVFMK